MKDNSTKCPSCNGCYWQGNCDGLSRCDDFTPINSDAMSEREYCESLSERAHDYHSVLADTGWDADE